MKKQLIILTFFLTFCLNSCGQTKNQKQQKSSYKIDSSIVAILPFKTSQYWLFKDCKPTELTNDDMLKIETSLLKCINDYNPEQERQFKKINEEHPEYELDKKNFIIDLTNYKRQYIAVLNSKGEKEVWINCFCHTWNKNWRKELIDVNDGGNCYFNLKINLTTGQYYELMVNGDA